MRWEVIIARCCPRTFLYGELSLAAYTMDMENELDFDLQQLKYVNIGKSRHQGIETGLRFTVKSEPEFVSQLHPPIC